MTGAADRETRLFDPAAPATPSFYWPLWMDKEHALIVVDVDVDSIVLACQSRTVYAESSTGCQQHLAPLIEWFLGHVA